MNIFAWLGKRIRLTDRSFWASYYGGETWAGEAINPETAMQISAFWACVRLISQTIGTLPMGVFENLPDGERKPRNDHDLYRLVHDQPNADHTAVEFWEGVGACLCLAGNSFAEKTYAGTGSTRRLIAMTLLNPAFMMVTRQADGSLIYRYTGYPQGEVRGQRDYTEDEIFHVRGFGIGGDLGLSPISYARQSLSAHRATERAAATTFANGMRPSGWLVYKGGILKPEQREEVRKNLIEPMSGAENAGKTGILEGDFDYRQMTIPPENAQLLETRAFGVEEVCRVHGVPPVLVGHASAGQTMWGCLPAGTKVLTVDGPVNIEAVRVGAMVWTLDGEQMVRRSVLRAGQTGVLPLYTIETRNRSVRATGNHKFLVRRKHSAPRPGVGGYRAVEWRTEWISAAELTTEDYVVTAHGVAGEDAGEITAPNGRALTAGAAIPDSSRIGNYSDGYVGRGPKGSRPGDGFHVAGTALARITAITRSEVAEPVFDLEIDGTHNFIADGVVVHNSGIEQIVIGWYTLGLRPYLTRIEQAVKRSLIVPAEKATIYPAFNLDGLLRADSTARGELYWKLFQVGAINSNWICDKENIPRHADGDRYFVNSTLVPMDQAGQVAPAPASAAPLNPPAPPRKLEVVK